MIIHSPEVQTVGDELSVSAAVETNRSLTHVPARLWFKFPLEYRDYVSVRGDGFLAALILPAMRLGEPVEVRGPVSPRLAGGLEHFQEAYTTLHPRLFQRVGVNYYNLQKPTSLEGSGGVAAAFSGGIDSLYTLWSHNVQSQADPAIRLTHGVFVHGFEIRLHEKDYYRELYTRYFRTFEALGLTLLQARTNLYSFSQFHLDWLYSHTGALAAVALTLGGVLRRFYYPAGSEIVHGQVKLAAYYVGDLSTEELEIRLDGAGLTRPPKLYQIKDWKPAQDHLRVCMNAQHAPAGQACYRCAKCLEAALYLELYGVRSKFRNFSQPMSQAKFIYWGYKTTGFKRYYPDLPRSLLEYHRYDLYALYLILAPLNEGYNFLRRNLVGLIPARLRLYLKRKLYANQVERASE